MKKFSILIAMMLVLAMATGAFAAQASYTGAGGNDQKYYSSTTPAGVRDTTDAYKGTLVEGVYAENQFKADGKTNYPYEIYLPNEATPANYRIHSNYTKNTDACAACHATHTAVGNALLQWYTIYDTCIACHDGTVTTTYNVIGGKIGATTSETFGGAFGNGAMAFQSSHNVTGAVEIAAAPGGSTVAETAGTNTRWTNEFGCESCHTPHGQGGNARILSPDPNYAATKKAVDAGWSGTGAAGISEANGAIVTYGEVSGETGDLATVNTKAYFTIKPSTTEAAYVDNVGNGYLFIKGYPYSAKVNGYSVVNDVVTVTSSSYWVLDNSKGYSRFIYVGVGSPDTIAAATYEPNVKVTGIPSIKIKMTIGSYLQSGETVQHNSGMNGFCGTCHTDYNTANADNYDATAQKFTGSDKAETGTYSKAHRHQVGFSYSSAKAGLKFETKVGDVLSGNIMECLTCHVAHGVNQDYWTNTLLGGNVYGASAVPGWTTTLVNEGELAGSSALKRMPNMGTCETCHAKGTGNDGYGANSGAGQAPSASVTDGIFTISASNVFTNFVGSTTCESCHKEQYDGWATTKHKTMLQAGTTGWMLDTAAEATYGADLVAAYNSSFDPDITTLAEFKANLKYTLGSKWKQRFIFASDTRGLVVLNGVKVQYNAATKTMADYNATKPTLGGKPWSGDCILCHTTGWNGVAVGNNLTGNDVQFEEPGISCEACHGAGANHVKAPSAKNINGITTKAQEDQVAICGKCHNRGFDNSQVVTPTGITGFTGRTREDYASAYADVTKLDTWAGLQSTFGLVYSSVANKTYYGTWNSGNLGFSNAGAADVYPDETAKGHHQQFNEFIQSGHFTSKLLTCTTCHNPHGKNVDNSQLKAQAQTICASCHDAGLNLDTYMPYISKSASARPYNTKTGAFATTNNAYGGDLRSHAFKTNWDYYQDSVGPVSSPDFINEPSLK